MQKRALWHISQTIEKYVTLQKLIFHSARTVHVQCRYEFLEISQTLYDYRGNNPHSAESAQSAPFFENPFYKSGQNRFLTVNALRV